MVDGSSADVAVTKRYVPVEEFRKVLEDAPAGVFTQDSWQKWHEDLGMPVPPLPRRHFPDGSFWSRARSFLRQMTWVYFESRPSKPGTPMVIQLMVNVCSTAVRKNSRIACDCWAD
jgi:hypothetical protein